MMRKSKAPMKKGKKGPMVNMENTPKINFTGAVAELMENAAETTESLGIAYKEAGPKIRAKSGKVRAPPKVGDILDRVQLFDKLNSPQFFPLNKIQNVISLIKGPNTSLKFTGVEQLTDLFFCTLADLKLRQEVNLDNVTDLDLTACHNLTDYGMTWLALCFSKLQKINLSGCKLVTEDGIYSLLQGCTELQSIDLTGTNIAILPRSLASLDVECGGCPILSPNLDDIKKHGLKMLEDPKYCERADNMVQICVIRSSTASQSLVKLLSGKNPTGEDAVEYLPSLQIGNIKANVMETDKCVIDLFIHKRTAYVLTFEGQEAKSVADELFAIICHVLSKDSNAVFLLVGMTTEKGDNCAKPEDVLKLVKDMADSTGEKIPRIKDVPLKGLDYTKQIDQVHVQMMAQSLGFLKCQCLAVNTHKKAKDQPDLLQSLQTMAEMAIKLCPSFNEIAKPLYLYLTSNSVDSTLKHGAASMSKVPISIRKTMELHHILGNAVCIRFLDGISLAVRPDQLAVALSTVLKRGKQPNTTQLSMVDDDTPVHLQDDFLEMLQEKLTPIQSQAAMGLIIKLPIGHISGVYLPFKYLKTESPVKVEEYFPKDPGPKVAMVSHIFTFHHPVDSIVIQRMAALCVQLRRPSAVWQYGIIMQDGYVDSLMLLSHNNGVSTLQVTSQTVIFSSKPNISWDMAWRQCLLYKLIVHYVLRELGLSFDVTIKSKEPKPAHIQPVICKHKFEVLADKPQPVCLDCGLTGSASLTIWDIYEHMNPAHMNPNMIYHQKEPNYKLRGCLLSPTQPNAVVYMTTEMKAYEQNSVKYTFLNTQGQSIKIALGARSVKQKCLQYDSSSGEVTVFSENGQGSVIGKGSPVADGETVEIRFEPTVVKGEIMTEVFIIKTEMRVADCMLGNMVFRPSITFAGENNLDALLMVHDHEPMIAASHSLEVGMRLEALDRLTPNLICVATIEKIDEKSGRVLIHFDGWTNRYDYWTEFETPDLHPVGYMEENGPHLGNKNPSLQAPKGYPKQFTWETYCKEIGHLPVPYHLFSESQCSGTPRDRTDSVYEACDAGMSNQLSDKTEDQGTLTATCKSESNEANRLETTILRSCVVNPAVIQFFLDNNKFFILLPRDLNILDLRHPSMTKISQNKNVNVHMLCPGLRSEILHFVNSSGLELDKFYPDFDFVEKWPSFLFMCYLGLILQDDMLPQTIDKIMPSVSETLKKDELQLVERGLQRVFYLYLLWLGLSHKVGNLSLTNTSKVTDSVLKFYVDLANNSEALKQIQQNFHGFDGSSPMRCMGHHLSVNLPQDTSAASLDQYKDYLQFLQKVDFHKHGMNSISEDFFAKFARAEDLNLSDNKIQKIPAGINMAVFLTHLNISKNEITTLPNELSELHETLLTLDISHNPLGDLPPCVLKLTSLTQLHANNIGKISSLRGIKCMKDLQVLCIGNNILESIPDELKDLPLLELDLSGVPWFPNLITERINPTMARFKSIVEQYIAFRQLPPEKLEEIFRSVDKDSNGTLDNEELKMLNEIIIDLFPRFGKDTLSNTETGGMPKVVYQLSSLQKLTVEFQCLSEITDHIGNLKMLKSINFSSTSIQSLSPKAGQLQLKEIHLRYCPSLKTPPKEVVHRGFNAVFGYLKRLSQGATSCRRTKLMMVGLGGAGKTSLVESLMSSYGTADLDYEEAITDGIDICQWNVPVKGEESIQFSVWDFAGQTVYYNTHQFFLSNRAIYMLVWNIRLGYEHAGLDFWLSSIACHAPKAPILIIGTHCDKVTKSSVPQQELKKAFPQIRDFFFVSSYTGEGISNLQHVLKTVALEQKYMGEKVPEAWLELERRMMKYREGSKKVDLLPWTEVEEEADTCGILDPVEMIQAIEFLHDLGSVIFFNTEFLRGYVVIYPQWIVDVMACIVTVHVGPIKEGKLLHKDMEVVWKKYPKNLHPWLLRLTEEFDLTFPLTDEEANLVPCLLPDTDTTYDWPAVNTDKGEKETKMIYTFKYLPAGLFNRAQVRLHGYSEGGKIWKKGMYLKKNNHIAVILQNTKSEVLARAQGYKPENILYLIHEVFEALIEESYAGVRYDFRIPCIECQNMNLTEPSMFAASRVYRAVELGAPFIQCENMFHTLSIPELQALMPPDKSADYDNHLRRSIQELQDINDDININVCFVFHKKNVPSTTEEKGKNVDPFEIMNDLRGHGFLVSFCDNPDTADLGSLTLSFKAAKVVIIGLSDEFASDPQCKRLFIYVKETLRMPFLLVVLGKGKEWMKSDLALSISSEVYVKMDDVKRYEPKIKEMYEAIRRKLDSNTGEEEVPRCFISYCWSNSKSAVDKGSKLKEGAVGWGDPRKLKHFLNKGGIPCWLDVERVGGKGLFEDIADGLRKAKIVVACVSDEYADSANCKMEFRFAACQLKIPVVIAVVGTGYVWERTEIGMLAVGNKYPKINLQYDNRSGLLDIMKMVQEKMPQASETKKGKSLEEQKEAAFQEVLEITQRQFLRQCIQFADSMNVAHYPRLVVVDFVQDKPLTKKPSTLEKNKEEECESPPEQAVESVEEAPLESGGKKNKMCFRVLCEHEEGWHEVDSTVPFPNMTTEDEDEWLLEIAPYAARILAVLKYTNLPLLCLNTPQGKQLQQKYESVLVESQEKNTDFEDAYTKARETVMEQDKERTCGGLRRCHLLNGKVRWLCEKHSQESGSKTEKKFHSELSVKSKEGVSTPHISKRESLTANKNAAAAKSPEPVQVQPQVFQMRQMQGTTRRNPQAPVKRQTSQACSVM